jgi:hypothetical protein
MKKTTLLFLISLPYLLTQASIVHAQSVMGLSAIPPRLDITVNPGEVITKEIKIRNESNLLKIINSSTKDFIVTNDSGTPVPLEEEVETENRWAASNWLHLSETKFRLKPGETKSILLTVIAPENALPGGHYSMIIHSPDNEAVLSETGSSVITNVGSLVYITVPGDIKQEAQLRQFSAPNFQEYGPVKFAANIHNLSDIHITPVGQITIKNWFNRVIAQLPIDGYNLFPYTSREYLSTLDKKWLFGRYQADLITAYGNAGGVLTGTIFFWVLPWRVLILVTLALIIIGVLSWTLIHRPTPPRQSEEVESLEKELEALKKKYRDRS